MAGIAFTYDVATPIGQARLYAGDTDGAGLNRTGGDRTRTDTEIELLLTQHGNDPRAAAAALLEGRAAEYAQAATRTEQGQLRQDLTERGRQCLLVAQALRELENGPMAQSAMRRVFTMGGSGGEAGTMDQW
jgi:hypothetical protein